MWGVSDRLEAYLKIKQAARGRPEASTVAWGASSGGGDGGGSSSPITDDRKREEADRIRGNLERVAKPAVWKRVSDVVLGMVYGAVIR